ncbi:hypothetical protein BGZ61DRAFT_494573 [Ilyonectria robusta]|uniref:uncharacterized protein n=1 Tax=Ilyonectria robusta TaxID=1079257 RepID=UPI001E8D5F6E|nr:uncharacterized protein BGZ61DRAFT_494573 [Ilyonectria robusta]KAH8688490.1 hypothetical protein BGZ61DRAFT_494573 [Ilyonectria robusta]
MTSTQNPPPVTMDYDIYPVHPTDDNKTNREKTMSWTLRFNDILDAEKIQDSLRRLLEIGDWRKLGGRLREKKDGKLELFAPQQFIAERPAFLYNHDALSDMSINEHPLASRLPKATEGPSLQKFDGHFRPLAGPPSFPGNAAELISQEAPQLSLNITSFNDATLVTISWPHILMDALGYQDLLRCWSLVVSGREEEVPPFLGATKDVLLEAEQSNSEKPEDFRLEGKRLGTLGTSMFLSRFVWDHLRNPPVETRVIFLPKKAFEKIQSQVQEEATAAAQDTDEKPFVGEGDALTAWFTRTVAWSEKKARPVTIGSLVNARFRLSALANQRGVYIQNMVLGTFTFLSPQTARGPMGPTAVAHRRHVIEQTTEQQTLSFMRYARRMAEKGGNKTPMFGEKDALPVMINNLTKAELIKTVDFSGAVTRQGDKTESRSNPVGSAVNYHFQHWDELMGFRNFFAVMGKDHDDNYWITAAMFPNAWVKFEEEIERLR